MIRTFIEVPLFTKNEQENLTKEEKMYLKNLLNL